MKKKRTRPTADDWARWAEGQRLLEEQIAILERKIEERKRREREVERP
jgi:hypothetical protein